jgi:transcriptional regulator with XRE-family HTH domain
MELRDAIAQAIHDKFDGSHKEFARAVGVDQATLSRWVTGKVKVPTADFRRRLAKVLGVRHADILVMAGEMWPSEVATVAANANGVLPGPSELDELWEQLPPDVQASMLVTIREMVRLTTRLRQAEGPVTLPEPGT